MSRSPWYSPRLLLVSTTVALLAAVATYVVLSGGEDDRLDTSAGDSPAATIPLEPADDAAADPLFTTFQGDEVRLSSLRGAPVVVNFFASTCVPCIEEMPAFEEVYREVGDEVRFLGLAVNDRPEDALELVERTGVTYPTAQDQLGEVVAALGGTVLPTTVLLDAEGDVVTAHSGALDAGELRELLADELGVSV